MKQVTVYIGLGSNINDPLRQVKAAIGELNQLPGSSLVAQSSIYRSAPMGPANQPDFINAVVCMKTPLSALALLDELQRIEQFHHRVRKIEWGPRTLDLDLLLYGSEVIENERLSVPHPGLIHRAFVLEPLLEIAPDLLLPDGSRLSNYAASKVLDVVLVQDSIV